MNTNEFIKISTNAQIASALIAITFLLMYLAFKKEKKNR